ncbi:MAG TPA: histone deacetylase family protein [Geminicoccus sp.]|uniref:histone deacetylase family protein n=1 Tax=Geminicoccus sp. TaxID=2024832 RepID=UPI002E31043A|nr:histone deacetylase family protein [Geminicoccus sp.]HEX2527844.1 histone deacetylase family protein [Geminicoccus sp.]
MRTIFSPDHALHHGRSELIDGQLQPCFEKPERAELVRARVEAVGLGPVEAPVEFGLEPIRRVHAPDYVAFLETAWDEWVKVHGNYDALPLVWPTPGLRRVLPDAIDGKLGYYSIDAGTPITGGTWRAIRAGANVALTGAAAIARGSERAIFSLCRPPGHHAGSNFFGGYCYFNNAAIAAQHLLDQGANRVAILDVDYHHGNGTQEIFYNRADVLVLNIHADPKQEYPYFLGHADEAGAGAGEGFNVNYPLPWGTAWPSWNEALEAACARLVAYRPNAVVVSLGVDTFAKDPISHFRLETDHFPLIGRRIARLDLPTHFVMEGGYAVEEIGVNAVGVLEGFEQG